MSVYAMDFGLLFFNQLEMQNAAQAGAHWALANAGTYNPNDIATAGANATKLLATKITVTSTEFCGCPSTTGVTLQNSTNPGPNGCPTPGSPPTPPPTPAICSGAPTCSGGALAGNYVAVCATRTTTNNSWVYGLVGTSPVQATAMVRIQ
jgi:hypothetical protein